MRATLLAAILAVGAVGAVGAAQAELPPLTIESVRGFAGAGMPPMNATIDILRQCPEMRGRFPSDMTPAEIAQARAVGIPAGALWARLHDAEIEKCLAGLSAKQRAID